MKLKNVVLATLSAALVCSSAASGFASEPADASGKKEKRITRFIERVDTDGDKKVSEAESLAALMKTFDLLDKDHDGKLSMAELEAQRDVLKAYRQEIKAGAKKAEASADAGKPLGYMPLPIKSLTKHFAKVDTDKDGSLSKSELEVVAKKVFQRRDKNNDGFISIDDVKA